MLLTAVLMAATGCTGPEGDASTEDSTLSDGDADDAHDGEPLAEAEGSIEDLSGHWGWKFALTYYTMLPIFNRKVTMLLTGTAVSDVTQVGNEFRFSEQICNLHMAIVEDINFEVFFPQRTIDSVPIRHHTATLTGSGVGEGFTTPPTLSILGEHEEMMSDPFTEPLPTEETDPKVLDQDADGLPGVTVVTEGMIQGKIYCILRLVRIPDGQVKSGSLIEGFNDSTAELSVLGASTQFLKLNLDLTKCPDENVNHFQLVRIPDGMDCVELENNASAVFSYDPMDFVVPLFEGAGK